MGVGRWGGGGGALSLEGGITISTSACARACDLLVFKIVFFISVLFVCLNSRKNERKKKKKKGSGSDDFCFIPWAELHIKSLIIVGYLKGFCFWCTFLSLSLFFPPGGWGWGE